MNGDGSVSINVELDDKKALQELKELKKEIEETPQPLENKKNLQQKLATTIERLKVGVQAAARAFGSLSRAALSFASGLLSGVARQGLKAFRDYFFDIARSMPQVRESIAEIKGNLLTAIQPIVNVLIPALQTLLQILVQVSAVLADIVAKIFRTTVDQSKKSAQALYDQAKAYKAAGNSASKAGKQVARFDELNILSDSSGEGASFKGDMSPNVANQLGALELLIGESLLALGAILTFSGVNIPLGLALMALGAAAIVAAAHVDWELLKSQMEGPIGEIFALISLSLLVLGAILAFSGANLPLGIALMAIGAAGLATITAMNWGKIKKELTGPMALIYAVLSGALLVIGAILAFSGISIPLGIALMAAGAAGLATITALNWEKIKEELTGPMAGIYAVVSAALLVIGAILVFSGISLPLGIALMAAGAAGLATVTALNWDKIKQELTGPMARVYAIVSAAVLVIGAILVFSGISLPLGIALMAAGAAGLAAVVALNWDKVKNILHGQFGGIMALISGGLLVLGIILTIAGVIPLGIALIVAGAAGLVTVTALNWDAIKEKIVGVWDSIRTWWQFNVAPIFTVDWWADKFASISEGLKQRVTDGINVAIDLFNRFIDWVNERLNISWKGLSLFGTEVISAGSYQLVTLPRIPRLAQGAVIPPNREFMAVLGDQKSGTNIEAPLDTIVAAFRQALGEMQGQGQDIQVKVYLDSREIKAGQQRLNRAMGV